MPLTAGICPNCGGAIIIDNTKKAGMCEYCHTPFIMEEAINYNTTINNNTFEHVDQVIINDEKSIDARVNSAVTSLFRLGDIKAAKEKFLSVTLDNASDYRGWLGLVMVESKEYIKQDYKYRSIGEIKEHLKNACKTAPDTISNQLEQIYNELLNNDTYSKEIRDINYSLGSINGNISKLKKEQEKYSTDWYYNPFKRVHPGLWIAIIITALLAIPTSGAMLIFTIPLAIVAGAWFFIANKSINKQINETASSLSCEISKLNNLKSQRKEYENKSDNLSGILAINNLDESILQIQ